MAKKSFLLPEARYHETYLPGWEDSPYYYIGEIVHVLPIEFIKQNNQLRVHGANFYGIIKIDELSIYPIVCFEENNIPKFLPNLFGNCITAEIIGFSDGQFILSRKITMQKALSNIRIGNIVEAKKTSIYSKTVFLDIGAGINAIIPINEVSSSYITDVQSVFKYMDYIPVKIIGESFKYRNKFIASYKQACALKEISKGDIVVGRVINLLEDHSGVYVEISPNQSGILDTDDLIVASHNDECQDADIIIGNQYSFLVQKIRDTKNGIYHYSLRLL